MSYCDTCHQRLPEPKYRIEHVCPPAWHVVCQEEEGVDEESLPLYEPETFFAEEASEAAEAWAKWWNQDAYEGDDDEWAHQKTYEILVWPADEDLDKATALKFNVDRELEYLFTASLQEAD